MISLVWTYTGLEPQEMEQRITSNSERAVTTLVNDVEHIESQSLNSIAVVKIYFQPTANVQVALAQTTAIAQTILKGLPPGTTPPLVAIFSASTVPVIQIGLTSDSLSEQQLFDFGNNFIRTQLATVQGAALPLPRMEEKERTAPGFPWTSIPRRCSPKGFRQWTSSTPSMRRTSSCPRAR